MYEFKTIRSAVVFCLIMIMCLHLQNAFSQVNVEWFRTYSGGWGKNFTNDFVIDSSGNSYLTGNISKNASNSRTAFGTVKFNSEGELLWAKEYEGSENRIAEGKAIVVDETGNVYVAGTCTDIDSSENFCTIKYNNAGDVLWIKKYHSSPGGRDEITGIAADADYNIYVTGFTYYYGSPYKWFWSTIKYDSSGNQVWIAKYEGDISKNKFTGKIIVDKNKNVYVTGSTSEFSSSFDLCTIKYDQNGTQQWISIFTNSVLSDSPSDITMDNFGNVYILGQRITSDGFYTLLLKYDNKGSEIWSAVTDSSGKNDGYYRYKISFGLDSENNIYIATTYRLNCCTIKYNSNGVLQWLSKFNGDPEYAYSGGIGLNIDKYGDIYTAGYTRFFGNVIPFLIIKYSPDGIIKWNRTFHVYNNIEFDEGAFVGFDKNNNVYIAGNHDDYAHNMAKYSLLKYSQSVGIKNISTEIPSDFNLYQNYPNPFNPVTKIQYEIPASGFVELKVYDVLGKEIIILVNEDQNAGKYETEFTGNELPGGLYFYKITSGNYSQTKKMLLIK